MKSISEMLISLLDNNFELNNKTSLDQKKSIAFKHSLSNCLTILSK